MVMKIWLCEILGCVWRGEKRRERAAKKKKQEKMVSISLYRGNLHRVSDAPRRWPMPPRAITLDQFRVLNRKRDEALARLVAVQKTPNSIGDKKGENREAKVKKEQQRAGGGEEELKNRSVSDSQPIKVEGESKGAEDCKTTDAGVNPNEESSDAAAVNGSEMGTTDVKIEVNDNLDTEKRKVVLEKKLEVLKEKKHHLVQMLKQILNAEEEIIRPNVQSAVLQFSVPPLIETAVDMGSATRHVPRLSVEVNFSGDLGAESDATANHSAQGHQMHHVHSTSSSAVSFTRPFQQNTFLSTSRSSLATSGHGQTPSNVFVGNSAVVTSSPSRFAATGHQGHHHSASLPPVSVPGSHFMASSPSPAASGGSSSVFRDSRLTSSS